ncbi:MAG: V-type ATP synthase subunit D [Sphaerochaetaceae bacterium]|jgi:V/A-type H+-transporting ATPase subunit D|nr:V-type ATP synthase subunit D [Sphaerochaetaceae bacterium]NLO61591.1 V-type ATP synthase subunit D [Spirochaetales bacterium]MDD2406316.1 V-type ATP synthase subunit D [Sphaerochaetaceae bacterium]MDD3670244.1 V-type ATP synthase subunit D [Sphaerochaetaceae bacterium]MDD4260047.1 V-type ATP synthase subunit D [Sphaerochaetaceae bacterium]
MQKHVAPTRSNLLRLNDELKFASLGRDLLDQKRSILVVELLTLVDQAVDYQGRVDKALGKAEQSLQKSIMEMGRLKVANLFGAIDIRSSIRLSERKVMGVRLPQVETTYSGDGPFFSPEGITLSVEQSLVDYREALELMGRLSQLKVSIMRLAREVKKTIRKVNALEKIVIPDLRETVAFTRARIEESERENFILMKMVKDRMEKSSDQNQTRKE